MNKVSNKKVRRISKDKLIKALIIGVVVIVTLVVAIVIVINYKKSKENPKEATTVNVEEAIDKYGYELTDTATDYYKDLFNRLKSLLSSDEPDEEQYASLVSQLFVSDLYNLKNKITSSDVGGVQYVYEDYQSDFKLTAQSTIYNAVQSNVYGDRNQELPVVSKATVESINQKTYKYNNTSDTKAYYVKVSIEYEGDLGYPDSVNLVLIHNNNKVEVAKMD